MELAQNAKNRKIKLIMPSVKTICLWLFPATNRQMPVKNLFSPRKFSSPPQTPTAMSLNYHLYISHLISERERERYRIRTKRKYDICFGNFFMVITGAAK